MAMTDSELLSIIKKDKNKGLSLLIDTYSGLVYKVVSGVIMPVGTKEDAEECASDVFLSFYKHIYSVDLSKGSIKGYLAVTAKRLGINMYHKLKMKKENETYSEDFSEICTGPEVKIEDKHLLIKLLDELGELDSTIIKRKYILGETAKEISQETGLSPDAVQKRLERSIKKLRAKLGGVMNGQY